MAGALIKPLIKLATKQGGKRATKQAVKRVAPRILKQTPARQLINNGADLNKALSGNPRWMDAAEQTRRGFMADIDVHPEKGLEIEDRWNLAANGDEDAIGALDTTVRAQQMSPLIDEAENAKQHIQDIADQKPPLSKEEIRFDKLKENASKTGNVGREGKAFAVTNADPEAPKTHRGGGQYPPERTGEGAITNLHHAGFLDKLFRAIGGHNSWINWKYGTDNPIAVGLEARGIKLGHWAQNMADVLSVMTDRSRQARIRALYSQAGGKMHEDTINDLLGGYGPTSEGVAFGEMSPRLAEAGLGTVESTAQDAWRSKPITIRNPDIPINRKNPKEGILEVWRPQTADEFARRFEIVSEKLRGYGHNVKEVPRIKTAKIGSKLDIYGGDHDLVHEITDILEDTPGNPIYEMKQAYDSGALLDMPVDQVVEMQYQQLVTMETVLGNILQKRYKHIERIFRKAQKGGMYAKVDFKVVPAEVKQKFFMKNINEIAAAGGIHKPIVTIDQALEPLTDWDEGLTEVFSWRPQTLNQPPRETIDAVGKEVKETI